MQAFLLVVQVLLSISLIALILIQHGKGADAGAAFGGGVSGTVFGARGSASFLSRTTAILATLFFAVSLVLSIMAHRQTEEKNLMEKYVAPKEATVQTPAQETDIPKAPAKSDVPAVKSEAGEVSPPKASPNVPPPASKTPPAP